MGAGCRDVVNGIIVDPPEEDAPIQIEEAVRIALDKDPLVDASQYSCWRPWAHRAPDRLGPIGGGARCRRMGCLVCFRCGRRDQRDRDWLLERAEPGLRIEKEKKMQIPLQISFRNMDPSPAVEAVVREKAAKLDRFFERIVSCDVTIEAPHRHHHKGKLYKVRIDIGMPGKDVHVNQEGPKNHAA